MDHGESDNSSHSEELKDRLERHYKRSPCPALHSYEEQVSRERYPLIDPAFEKYPAANGNIDITHIEPGKARKKQDQNSHYELGYALGSRKLDYYRVDI